MTVKVDQLGLVPLELIKVKDRYRVDKGDIDALAESMKEKGQIQAIVVDAKMRLQAGERRMLAARKLGWDTIRAEMRTGDTTIDSLGVELDENLYREPFTWPEIAKLEKVIFDMKAAKDPKWSLRKQEEYRDTSKSLVGMRLQLAEALELLPELAECETQDEAWKQYKKLEEVAGIAYIRSKLPEEILNAPKWAEDHYRIGDALVEMPLLAAESVDFAEVDPPYGIDLLRRKGRNADEGHTGDYNEVDAKKFPKFMQAVITETYRTLRPNSFAVIWYGMQWHCDIYKWLEKAGFAVNPMCALWYKGQSGQTAQPDVALASTYEPFFLARKGQPKMRRQGRANVFHYQPLPPSKKGHPTEKPIELLTDILDTMLFPGSTVLVPFLGSGVTLRAAYKLGHTGLGFDLAQGNKDRFLETVAREFANGAEPETADEPA